MVNSEFRDHIGTMNPSSGSIMEPRATYTYRKLSHSQLSVGVMSLSHDHGSFYDLTIALSHHKRFSNSFFLTLMRCVCVRAGGWQQQMTFQRHVQNLQRFYRMLRNNGLHKDHIKTFFAGSGQLPGTTVLLSETKNTRWIRRICLRKNCQYSSVIQSRKYFKVQKHKMYLVFN